MYVLVIQLSYDIIQILKKIDKAQFRQKKLKSCLKRDLERSLEQLKYRFV